MLYELAWFLPWCWFVNMSLNVLGYATMKSTWLRTHERPLDGGYTFLDKNRILGNSTTLGGVIVVLIEGAVGTLVFPAYHLFTLAVLVYLGHAFGSFIKRRLGIPSGRFLAGVDHGDYIFVAGTVWCALGRISLNTFFVSWFVTLALTPFVTTIAFRSALRKRPL